MTLFFIGILEMIVISVWTKMVTETKVLMSGMVTFVNILIWYYVLSAVVDDIQNISLVILYAVGCALGTMLTTTYFRWSEVKKAKSLSN